MLMLSGLSNHARERSLGAAPDGDDMGSPAKSMRALAVGRDANPAYANASRIILSEYMPHPGASIRPQRLRAASPQVTGSALPCPLVRATNSISFTPETSTSRSCCAWPHLAGFERANRLPSP